MMRATKVLTGLGAALLVFSLEAVSVFAAEPVENEDVTDYDTVGVCGYCSVDCPFVDEDGDGICDNYAAGICGQGFVDEDGDGVCDNFEAGICGQGFVDEDGNGICDNFEAGVCGYGGRRGCGGYGRRGCGGYGRWGCRRR